MQLRFINTYERNPWYNLAVENAALEMLGEDEILFYLWQNQHTVVIGRGQNPWRECRVQLLEKEGGVLARRPSGGGAVYHDMGNLNFSLIVPARAYDLEKQLRVIIEACREIGLNVAFSGRNDILLDGAKFSGNAFRQTKNSFLHHGTLMVDVEMDRLSRYLMPPKAKLQAKGVASVRSRVCNLKDHRPDLTTDDLRELLFRAFEKVYEGEARVETLDDWDKATQNRIRELYLQYASWEWRFGQTMNFNVSLETRFPWGGMTLDLRLVRGHIEDLYVDTDAMDAEMSNHIRQAILGCHYGPEMIEALEKYAATLSSESGQQLHQVSEWVSDCL